MVMGRIGMSLICDLWVRFVICGCGFVLWCAVDLFCGGYGFVGDAVLVPWWWLCHIFFFCLVWVEEKIGDLGFFLFYFIFYCDVYIILLC